VDQSFDLMADLLADANLTPEQREIWNTVRAELIMARERIEELEARLKALDLAGGEEPHIPVILSRPEFNREVARMLAFDERYGGISSVLYFDFDNLSDIHRSLGGQIADAVVQSVCDSLLRHVRSSDLVGRLATDEFGVLLVRCDNPSAWRKGEALADIIMQNLAKIPGCTITPVVNFGAYTFKEKESVTTGIKRASESITKSEKG